MLLFCRFRNNVRTRERAQPRPKNFPFKRAKKEQKIGLGIRNRMNRKTTTAAKNTKITAKHASQDGCERDRFEFVFFSFNRWVSVEKKKELAFNISTTKEKKKKYFMRKQYSWDSNIICVAFEKSSIAICFFVLFAEWNHVLHSLKWKRDQQQQLNTYTEKM